MTSLWGFLRRYLFGKPDGTLPWLRCRVFGHAWYQCEQECCDGQWWCFRCLAPRPEAHA